MLTGRKTVFCPILPVDRDSAMEQIEKTASSLRKSKKKDKVEKGKGTKLRTVLLIVKYAFAVLLTFEAYTAAKSKRYPFVSLLELFLIFMFCSLIARRHPLLGKILNGILYLLYMIQQAVMWLASSYVSILMLTNLVSVEDLSGRSGEYIGVVVVVALLTILPGVWLHAEERTASRLVILFLIFELGFTMVYGSTYSPLFGYFTLGQQGWKMYQTYRSYQNQKNVTADFYNASILQARDKPDTLPDKPNVIVIFTEGLSQNIVEDERNIMPNVAAYEKRSINFTNYYNHTAATYRGLIGQLYSGYQEYDQDRNTLISMEDILKDEGYYTAFLNMEPNNSTFTAYLKKMNFDDVLSPEKDKWVSDKECYEFLLQEAEEREKEDQPFFLAVYTFFTHVSFDYPGEEFGDGSQPELNKFYNDDYQFGKFMEAFEESSLSDDTIIVFTSDHCTYEDDVFHKAFPNYERAHIFLDRIPFFIYYKGVQPETIDVNGRNSLCLAPTVLDFLDISEPNYFLGQSLFLEYDSADSPFDTIFTYLGGGYCSTAGGTIQGLDETQAENKQLIAQIEKYLVAKRQKQQVPD